jgi:drug/metabolite transporter (DMT)-like permease
MLAAGLVGAVFLWGGNNAGVKYLVTFWPPIWVGGTRFLCAGLLLLAVVSWTRWLGPAPRLDRSVRRRLWWQGGLPLAAYIMAFNYALHFTAASHVALYLGASPVWALLWEGRGTGSRVALLKRYAAALLAFSGVMVLFWPVLLDSQGRLPGELLGLLGSGLWTWYGRQCRALSGDVAGASLTAHTMWRAGVLLLPFGLLEISRDGLPWSAMIGGVQLYCTVAGGVVAFALWNRALRHWQTSEVYLFTNLIPLSTMLWAHLTLGEPITRDFWTAMVLIVAGVLLGQADWQRLLGKRWWPAD